MSKGPPHSGLDSDVAVDAFGVERWRPIPIIRVDLDSFEEVTIHHVRVGQRLWVEVVRDDQVVGIVDAAVESGGLSTATLKTLLADLMNVRLPHRETVADELLPRATVVVPTICNAPAQLLRVVDALLALDYPDFEVLIVDNRPDPNKVPFPAFPGEGKVRVYEESWPGTSSARNCGVAHATGEFVAFTDDDVIVDKNWLRELGSRFVTNPEVDGIGGLVLPLELITQPQLWFEEFYGGFSKAFSVEIFSIDLKSGFDDMFPYAPGQFGAGCNMAFRLAVLQEYGCFDPCLGTGTPAKGGEDLALFLKLVLNGKTLAFEPRALARHSHRVSKREFMTQVFGYGAGLTAMFTALVVREPRHLAAMIRRIPGGIRLLKEPRRRRSPSYPRRAHAVQLLGMAYGPFAYARSVATFKLKG